MGQGTACIGSRSGGLLQVLDLHTISVSLLDLAGDDLAVTHGRQLFVAHQATARLLNLGIDFLDGVPLGGKVFFHALEECAVVAACLEGFTKGGGAAEFFGVDILDSTVFQGGAQRGLGEALLAGEGDLSHIDETVDGVFFQAVEKGGEVSALVADCEQLGAHSNPRNREPILHDSIIFFDRLAQNLELSWGA